MCVVYVLRCAKGSETSWSAISYSHLPESAAIHLELSGMELANRNNSVGKDTVNAIMFFMVENIYMVYKK